ncbi:hypothetical protein GQ457_01G025220 [Hibiscus cannabinus]
MAEAGFSSSQPLLPIFNEPTQEEEERLKETKSRDAKALFILQQAVHDIVFSRIAATTTSKEAWSILQTEFQGGSKVIVVKLQALRRDFETLSMNNGETIPDFLSIAMSIVSQIRSYGEQISDETIVAKVLRGLTSKFDHVVAAIEESKDLSVLSVDELMGSLQAHESRINRSLKKNEENAFQVKETTNKYGENYNSTINSRGGRGFRYRGRGGFYSRGRGSNYGNRKNVIQCYHCGRYMHIKAYCWYNDKKMNFAMENEEENKLFMACIDTNHKPSDLWFGDSGCSNHMTCTKSLFQELDEMQKIQVQLGNKMEMQVEGKGTIGINTDRSKVLNNVQFIPELGHNLLSVGQLMAGGCSLVFDDNECVVTNKKSGQQVHIGMTPNKMFPLDVSTMENFALAANAKDDSELWHLRYGHLNVKGLKLLSDKGMVQGLPKINSIDLCDGCINGKQTRKSFPVGKAWRASKCLKLIHADLCGPIQTEPLGGSHYFLLFTDDYSRMSWVYFLTNKSETFENFQRFKAMVEKQSNNHIKILRTNRGGEFMSNIFNFFCEENGIKRELTTPYTPEQNGVAERKNRTVVEMARSMLRARGLLDQFWAEAVATSVYLLNLSPTRAVLNRTPYEAWYERRPSILIRRDVIFDERKCWDWDEKQVQQDILVSIGVSLDGKEESVGTISATDSSTTATNASVSATPSRDPPSSTDLEESLEETPPRKYRSLTDIYASHEPTYDMPSTRMEECSLFREKTHKTCLNYLVVT